MPLLNPSKEFFYISNDLDKIGVNASITFPSTAHLKSDHVIIRIIFKSKEDMNLYKISGSYNEKFSKKSYIFQFRYGLFQKIIAPFSKYSYHALIFYGWLAVIFCIIVYYQLHGYGIHIGKK